MNASSHQGPLSLTPPTAEDERRQQQLVEVLQKYGAVESDEERLAREEVLGRLNELVRQTVANISARIGYGSSGDTSLNNLACGARICTFGSFRLGAHLAGGDIDVLAVGPRHVERNAFFAELVKIFAKVSDITSTDAVLDAKQPIVKIIFKGIDLDIQYVQLMLARVPDKFDVLDPALMKAVAPNMARSWAGPRVADQLLQLVPNQDAFRLALRTIKIWAGQRAIANNKVGYLGGIAWAILVVLVCQLYPKANGAMLVVKFFETYRLWSWKAPVLLKSISPPQPGFNPDEWYFYTNPRDRRALMPIVTPVEPPQNSTANVSRSTKSVLIEEFIRGNTICKELLAGEAQWEKLFERTDFFRKYTVYLMIAVGGNDPDEARRFVEYIQSRMPAFLRSLDALEFVRAHIYPDFFPISQEEAPSIPNPHALFIGFRVEKLPTGAYRAFDLTYAARNFQEKHVSMVFSGRSPGMVGADYQVLDPHQLPLCVREKTKAKKKKKVDSTDSTISSTAAAADTSLSNDNTLPADAEKKTGTLPGQSSLIGQKRPREEDEATRAEKRRRVEELLARGLPTDDGSETSEWTAEQDGSTETDAGDPTGADVLQAEEAVRQALIEAEAASQKSSSVQTTADAPQV